MCVELEGKDQQRKLLLFELYSDQRWRSTTTCDAALGCLHIGTEQTLELKDFGWIMWNGKWPNKGKKNPATPGFELV